MEISSSRTVPEIVAISWKPFDDFTRLGFDDDSDWFFVDGLIRRIRAGEDIPPLLRSGKQLLDGVHRAWAARKMGLRLAPTIDLLSG